jgi:hypothetical protein
MGISVISNYALNYFNAYIATENIQGYKESDVNLYSTWKTKVNKEE